MRRLLYLLALILGACSQILGGEPWPGSERPRTWTSDECVVGYVDTWGHAGLRHFYREPQEVTLRYGMEDSVEKRVVTHELLHVAGYGRHIPSRRCYFRSYAGSELGPLCAAEIEKIRAVNRTYTLRVRDVGLYEAVCWAAAKWNKAAGREVFVVKGL